MKKRAIFGVALAAAGAAGWYLTANRRKNQMEIIREQVRKLLAVRRDELQLLRKAAQAGELPSEGLSTQPLDGLEVEAVRLEDGALLLGQPADEAVDERHLLIAYTERVGIGTVGGVGIALGQFLVLGFLELAPVDGEIPADREAVSLHRFHAFPLIAASPHPQHRVLYDIFCFRTVHGDAECQPEELVLKRQDIVSEVDSLHRVSI